MINQSFTCSFSAAVTQMDAFESVHKRVPEWWTRHFEGSSQQLNDVFTTTFGETYGTFKIVEIVPDEKIMWLCTDCNLHFLKNKKEWKDTSMIWEFSNDGRSTTIRFTHDGLVPALECFEDCCGGWTHYVKKSLFRLLTEFQGMPDDENYSAKNKQ